ncbi:hypothetical protein ACU686_30040 [Yinghuangia aomiensis]
MQPLLWRAKGWVRVGVNIAGYGKHDDHENHEATPPAPLPVALGCWSRSCRG